MTTVAPPFTDGVALTSYLVERIYGPGPHDDRLGHWFEFYGVANMDELMAIPARLNSGELGTYFSCWFALFPFVDLTTTTVEVDEVAIGGDGYSFIFWGRWNGECAGSAVMPDGSSIDLTGTSFEGLRYSYRLSFDRLTKRAILFEGLFDVSEWGRLMGSSEFAVAAATRPIYPS